jgi:tetratricopeptide (TPR) repeat protein
MSRAKKQRNSKTDPAAKLSYRKLWLFRLAAMIGLPLLFLGLLEGALRLAGYGYPTSFLLKSSNGARPTFIQNDRFGWRFFGPRAARLPAAFSIPRPKPADTIRIFVFGESAAYGDPQPAFGLPRMLEAMLELRHPGRNIEVVNAAMTGINSHVIVPLAKDCTRANGDVWVIYMGNNEVVGPYGAGSVFGSKNLPLPMIRAGLALKATRLGQLFDAFRGAMDASAAANREWGGMGMFVGYRIGGNDPRLATIYANFDANLRTIIAAGERSGARIVLGTMGANLRDCGPFASLHGPSLPEQTLAEWQSHFSAGTNAQAAGNFAQAAAEFDAAEKLDAHYAELRFRRGQCAWELKDYARTQAEFTAARDEDALRFRCDSQMNQIIRSRASDRVALADCEQALAAASAGGIPGADLFFDHVHFTFQGNYLISRAIAEKVEQQLALPANPAWPDASACAQRLAYSQRDLEIAVTEMLGRLSDTPFTLEPDHEDQLRRLSGLTQGMPTANAPGTLSAAQSAAETALARWPDDAVIWQRLAEIKQASGDFPGALTAVQSAIDRLPSDPDEWLLKGILLAQGEQYQEALTAFRRVADLNPQAVWARHNLALCLEKLHRDDEAIAEFKKVLALKPTYGTGWLALGELYESMGRTNDADGCYHTALTNRVNQADDLIALARFCFNRHWFDLAVTNFAAAIEQSPMDASLRLEAGRAMEGAGRDEEAVRQFQTATSLAPDLPQAHLQLAIELGRMRQSGSAEVEFREALRLDPTSMQAGLGLGISLYQQGKLEAARAQFEQVLQQHPNDPTALRYEEQLRARLAGQNAPPQ